VFAGKSISSQQAVEISTQQTIKFDILTGRRAMVRKLGDSTIMRFPPKVLDDYGIKPGDYALFEEKPEGILIKPVHAKELGI